MSELERRNWKNWAVAVFDAVLIYFRLEVSYLIAGKAARPNGELVTGSERITERPVRTLETPKQLSCHLPLLSADQLNGGGDWGALRRLSSN